MSSLQITISHDEHGWTLTDGDVTLQSEHLFQLLDDYQVESQDQLFTPDIVESDTLYGICRGAMRLLIMLERGQVVYPMLKAQLKTLCERVEELK